MIKRKINLLFVNYSFDMGGIEVLIKSLCQCLDRELFNITLCSFSNNNGMESEFQNMGIPVIVLKKNPGIDLTLLFKLRRLCKRLEIDIMHTHNAAAWLYGVLSCLGKRLPSIIHTQHTVLEKEEVLKSRKNKHVVLLLMMKFLSLRTAYVVSIADYITRYLSTKAKIRQNKITLIYNGTNFKKWSIKTDVAQTRAVFGLSDKSFVIGIVARLIAKKGHKVLLAAFKQIKFQLPLGKLVIVGDGVLKQELEDYCRFLGIGDDVLFLGKRNDIPEILQIMNVFVLSSYKDAEGLPVCLLEAMASRIPVIATDSGGSGEIVLNNKTGILLEPGNVTALAEAIIKIQSEKESVEEMVNQAEERVCNTFSLEGMVNSYTKLYLSCFS